MKRLLALLALVPLALATGCASQTLLSAEDRTKLQHDLTTGPSSERYLKASSYITPFFGDSSKRLLTPYPPEEVRLLNDTKGNPINPGPAQALMPAGTQVRVLKVEFPTAWVMAERVLYSPRTQPWVYLDVKGAPPGPPVILVLPPQLKTKEEVLAELDRHLLAQDPTPRISKFQSRFQDALRQKKVLEYMPEAAVEMSWGPPESIRRTLDGQQVHQEWAYPGGKRRVFITDGLVTRVDEGTPAATK
ncbi:hypothetical protein F0U60_26510 [Archangium minus]|uniref:Lipoprotein n=1 Tax=Archangium minus TaxID=83450 RepID=A0ABY9WVM4_9BACT|nr:hypothetical protein F0U61_26805 [Archangium violaceum]WNG47280.1 hypothetical protein F0U60_26510 [Archangium minus]